MTTDAQLTDWLNTLNRDEQFQTKLLEALNLHNQMQDFQTRALVSIAQSLETITAELCGKEGKSETK